MSPSVEDAQISADVKARLLPVEEWERLREYGPFREAGGVLPDPAHAFVLVLEDAAGEFKGCWLARDMVLLEALFLSEDMRHRATPAKALFFGMVGELHKAGVTQVMTLIQASYVEALAVKAGFKKLDGAVHLLQLKGGV